jgi:hypothetical protein
LYVADGDTRILRALTEAGHDVKRHVLRKYRLKIKKVKLPKIAKKYTAKIVYHASRALKLSGDQIHDIRSKLSADEDVQRMKVLGKLIKILES